VCSPDDRGERGEAAEDLEQHVVGEAGGGGRRARFLFAFRRWRIGSHYMAAKMNNGVSGELNRQAQILLRTPIRTRNIWRNRGSPCLARPTRGSFRSRAADVLNSASPVFYSVLLINNISKECTFIFNLNYNENKDTWLNIYIYTQDGSNHHE
jgi:hypothetical protein